VYKQFIVYISNTTREIPARPLVWLTHSLTHSRSWPFLRSSQLCRYSRTSQHFMGPESLLLCSQEPPPPAPILSQINLIHTIPSYLSKIHFNIIHPPTSRLTNMSIKTLDDRGMQRSVTPFSSFCNMWYYCFEILWHFSSVSHVWETGASYEPLVLDLGRGKFMTCDETEIQFPLLMTCCATALNYMKFFVQFTHLESTCPI
jgi:hypothetical protein